MKNIAKTLVAAMTMSLFIAACTSKPAETTEVKDSTAAEAVVDSTATMPADSTATDSTAAK